MAAARGFRRRIFAFWGNARKQSWPTPNAIARREIEELEFATADRRLQAAAGAV
jgi:hypothetical protein